MFAAIQTEFAQSLLDSDRPVPAPVVAYNSRSPARRFAVYRNNVVVGLVNALRARFPATERIVGDEFFAAMARVFVTTRPPRSPLLMRYGDDFADFIAAFELASGLPYLPDVARIEAARTRAYHAVDRDPIDPARLRAVDPEALQDARITLHPSTEILRSRFSAVTIWAMNSGEAELAPVDDDRAEDALVLRPGFQVLVRMLPPGGAVFLRQLSAGGTLGAAAQTAALTEPQFDLAANLAGLIGSGVMADLILDSTNKDRSP